MKSIHQTPLPPLTFPSSSLHLYSPCTLNNPLEWSGNHTQLTSLWLSNGEFQSFFTLPKTGLDDSMRPKAELAAQLVAVWLSLSSSSQVVSFSQTVASWEANVVLVKETPSREWAPYKINNIFYSHLYTLKPTGLTTWERWFPNLPLAALRCMRVPGLLALLCPFRHLLPRPPFTRTLRLVIFLRARVVEHVVRRRSLSWVGLISSGHTFFVTLTLVTSLNM